MTILETVDVNKWYQNGLNRVHALKNVNLKVEQGEFTAIVGTSGSGKSTLLHLLGGLDVPDSGSVMVRSHDLAKLGREELTIFRRRNIGFVFQDYSLIPVLDVYENVALPVNFDNGRYLDACFIRRLLEELGIWEMRRRFPDELSGGQQQRAAIARALVNKPAVILADEPTGNLDSKTTVDVMGLLKNSARQYHQTILMVTHNEHIAQTCDRIIRIEDGIVMDTRQ